MGIMVSLEGPGSLILEKPRPRRPFKEEVWAKRGFPGLGKDKLSLIFGRGN